MRSAADLTLHWRCTRLTAPSQRGRRQTPEVQVSAQSARPDRAGTPRRTRRGRGSPWRRRWPGRCRRPGTVAPGRGPRCAGVRRARAAGRPVRLGRASAAMQPRTVQQAAAAVSDVCSGVDAVGEAAGTAGEVQLERFDGGRGGVSVPALETPHDGQPGEREEDRRPVAEGPGEVERALVGDARRAAGRRRGAGPSRGGRAGRR